MNFISNFLISLSNHTIPLGWIAIIIGLGCGFLRSFAKYLKFSNDKKLEVIKPEAEAIIEKYKNDEKTKDEKLSELYAKHNFSVLPQLVLNIVAGVVFFLMLSSIINIKSFDTSLYTNDISFFSIKNIFERQLLIVLPLLTGLARALPDFLFKTKQALSIKNIAISLVVNLGLCFLLSYLFTPIYSLFIFGSAFGILAVMPRTNKLKREIALNRPATTHQDKPNTQKSLKEKVKEVDSILDDMLKPKK